MTIRQIVSIISFVAVTIAVIASLNAADLEGSRDHPLFKRYDGAEIVKYSFREYDDMTIPLGKARSSSELEKSIHVEGVITRLTYKIPLGRSPLEIIRNYEKELVEMGFLPLFSGGGTDLGSYFAEAAGYKEIKWPPNIPALTLNSDTQRFLAAEKKGAEDTITVALYAIENRFWAGNLKDIEKGQVLLQVDIIQSRPMELKMVTVAAEEMAEKIGISGSVALYGIYFDTGKADIRAESSATLEQVAKLLQDDPALKLLVVGHTDNVGTFAYNMELSMRRATMVVNELQSRYSTPVERLFPVGVSYACPVASNSTEEGRAKNRRVALVKN
jgi:outer membrane protein OmpA-like peptidoglycan-associated protein